LRGIHGRYHEREKASCDRVLQRFIGAMDSRVRSLRRMQIGDDPLCAELANERENGSRGTLPNQHPFR
jgi:hypothetical protein